MSKKLIHTIGLLAVLFLIEGRVAFQVYAHDVQSQDTIGSASLKASLGKIQLLDVRSEKEYAQEHIETALVIPLLEISEARLAQLGFKKEQEVVVYANSDSPAQKAKRLLNAMGFTTIKILSGGLAHWKEDGLPTVSGKMNVVGTGEKEQVSAITLQPKEYGFGMITKEKGIVKTVFALTNTGTKDVVFEAISTSCGCTSAEVSENVVQPGKTVSLVVSFDPNFHQEPEGRFSRTVFLQTSEGVELQAKIYLQMQASEQD